MGEPVTEPAQQRIRSALDRHLATGAPIGPMPDGPTMDAFNALEMAQAIESEVNRAPVLGFDHVSVKMTLDDASRLAAFMRRAVVAGV